MPLHEAGFLLHIFKQSRRRQTPAYAGHPTLRNSQIYGVNLNLIDEMTLDQGWALGLFRIYHVTRTESRSVKITSLVSGLIRSD